MRAVVILLLALAAVDTRAQAGEPGGLWLPGDRIVEALGGKTLGGRYANGHTFIERYLSDGRLEYSEDGQTMGGHWSVTAGTLCTIYDSDPAGGCYRVTKAGANCFEFYFAARTEAAAPGPEGSVPAWTAQGSVASEPATCHDGANV